MKWVAVTFSVCVTLVIAYVLWISWPWTSNNHIGLATFVVTSLSLIVLTWYAYDNNSIARITQERWKREGLLGTSYSMELVGTKDKPGEGRTLFRLRNASPLVVRAKVNCNFRIYGEPVEAGPPYTGKDLWVLFPQQLSQGWFSIEDLLKLKGKSIAGMITESNPQNREKQFTMLLELQFSDEFGQERVLPGRSQYFDFERWTWIPHLTEGEKA